MRTWLRVLSVVAALTVLSAPVHAQECRGRFPNPVTDICWSCIFPVSIGGIPLMTMGQEDFDSGARPVCACASGASVTVGLNMSFWEPVRIFEQIRHPGCFPVLQGLQIDFGIHAPAHANNIQRNEFGASAGTSFYHAHWYMAPWLFVLEVLLDTRCLEQAPFDMAYVTELDPIWDDSDATFVLNPDAALFTSLAANAACAADAVAAMTGFAVNELFWCAGAAGRMYPLNGWVGAHNGLPQSAMLLVQRFTNKLHREGVMWAAFGQSGQCGYYLQPIMDKRAYKTQMIWPSRVTQKIGGRCCYPYGRTHQLWQAGKTYALGGEDAAIQIFRKRDCCQGGSYP